MEEIFCEHHIIKHIKKILKDHVTLKTGEMAAENTDLPSQENKYHLKIYSNWNQLF